MGNREERKRGGKIEGNEKMKKQGREKGLEGKSQSGGKRRGKIRRKKGRKGRGPKQKGREIKKQQSPPLAILEDELTAVHDENIIGHSFHLQMWCGGKENGYASRAACTRLQQLASAPIASKTTPHSVFIQNQKFGAARRGAIPSASFVRMPFQSFLPARSCWKRGPFEQRPVPSRDFAE